MHAHIRRIPHLLLLTSLAFTLPSPAFASEPQSAPAPAIDKKDLRYDGKDFAYWRNYLMTELKEECRVEALKALGTLGHHGYATETAKAIIAFAEAYPDVVISTRDPLRPYLRDEAVKALDAAGADVLPILIDGLKREKSRLICLAFLRECVEIPVSAQLALWDHVVRGEWQVGAAAASVLADHHGQEAEVPRDRELRRRLVAALAKYLEDRRLYESQSGGRIVHLLGAFGPDAAPAIPILIAHLDKPTTEEGRIPFAREAIEALGSIGRDAEKVVPTLMRVLDDPDEDVRAEAACAIGKFGPQGKRATEKLWCMVQQPPRTVRTGTISLVSTGWEAKPAAATEEKEPEKADVQIEALTALARIGEPAAKTVPRLAEALHWNTIAARQVRAIETLARMGPAAKAALPVLELETNSGDVKQARDVAIRAIRDKGKE